MDTNAMGGRMSQMADTIDEWSKWLQSNSAVDSDYKGMASNFPRFAQECRNAGRLMDEMEKALRGARDALVEAGRIFASSNPLASRPNLFELHARAVCEVLARVTPRVVPIPECAPEVKCDNCNWSGTADQTRPARDLWKRMDPGGPVPAGECPVCGCFAYQAPTYTARMEATR